MQHNYTNRPPANDADQPPGVSAELRAAVQEQKAKLEAFEAKHNLDRPAHGGDDNPYAALKVIEAWGVGFHLGKVLKYICSADLKTGETRLSDLQKAQWCLDCAIYDEQMTISESNETPGKPF